LPQWKSKRAKQFALTVALLACVGALFTDARAMQAALLGLGVGSLIAALALGVVVTYRGSGVVNIATGAMAMYASYIFNALNHDGDLLIAGWTVHIGAPWPFLPSLIATLMIAALWSGVGYRLIFAPLADASPVAKVVASVGLLVTLQAVVVLAFSARPVPVNASLSHAALHLPSNIIVPENQVILAAAVLVAAAVLWAIYRYSRFGMLTRAAAEDERHLSLLGHSPRLVSGGNWVFAGVVTALFGVLIASVSGSVDPTVDVLLVVPALAAALIGRFTSFSWCVVAGLGIGMAQALLQYLGTKSWFPTSGGLPLPGVQEAVPLVIILVGLLVQKRGLGARGGIGNVRLPFSPAPRHVAPKLIAALIIGTLVFLVLGPEWRLAGINTLVGITICISLVILAGFVGQVSLAQMAYAGIAGFLLSKLGSDAGIGFPFAPLLAAMGAAAFGVLTAFPALRLRGVQLAVMTIATGVAVQAMVFENPVIGGNVTPSSVKSPSIFGFNFGPLDPSSLGDGKIPDPWFGIFCTVLVVLIAWFASSLRSSAWGRRMLAVRANERAAAAAGISVSSTKVVAFTLSAFVAGLAGALSGYRFGVVTPEYFGVLPSLTFLCFAYMGGISSVTGGVIGGFLVTNGLMFTALQQWAGVPPEYAALIGGLGLIVTVVLNPEGIAGAMRAIALRARPGRRFLGVPDPPESPGKASGPEASALEGAV
jgi:branched-chain amino acid transport system permease protein